jgi:hypothetical protein
VSEALSIRQPWAILEAGKRIENRDWAGCSYRDRSFTRRRAVPTTIRGRPRVDRGHTRRHADAAVGPELIAIPPLRDQPRGVLVGIARIIGATRHPEYPTGYHGYRIAGALGLELADVRKLPPIPFKGMLGFFSVFLTGLEHAEAYSAAWAELTAKGVA